MKPVFDKDLVSSNVKGVCQLPLRKNFYEAHLPRHDCIIVLVDESEREYDVRFVVKVHKLQSGWRKFVSENGLVEGDTVEFYPINQICKFKVCIKRANRSIGTKGARTGQSNKVNVPGLGNSALRSCPIESLPGNSRKRSPVTYLNGPKGKIRKMSSMVKLHCGDILSELMNHSSGWIFNKPVDPVELNLPDYFSEISEPMDLGTIKKKLEENSYSRMEKFADDVRLTFSNAMKYNPPDHKVHKCAKQINCYFEKKWKSLEAKLKHKGPASRNNDGQDSWQSTRESFQDNEKERRVGADARAGKVNIERQHKSREANAADGKSHIISPDCSNDDETMLVSDCDSTPLTDQSHGNSESGIIFKGFEDFKVHINGENLNSEIPPDIRMKYYQLCCGQKKFIHELVMKGLHRKQAVDIILEIVRIADAVKVANICTSPADLECMEKTLKYYKELNMAVESLHAKLCVLINYSKEHQTIDESTRVKVAEIEKERTVLQETNSKIDELKESAKARGALIGDMEVNIEALKEKREKLRFVFNEVAGFTW